MDFLKDPQTNWKYIAGITVLGLAVSAGVVWYQWRDKQSIYVPEVKILEKVSEPEKVSVDKIFNWETYRSEEYGFEFEYPDVYAESESCKVKKIVKGLSVGRHTFISINNSEDLKTALEELNWVGLSFWPFDLVNYAQGDLYSTLGTDSDFSLERYERFFLANETAVRVGWGHRSNPRAGFDSVTVCRDFDCSDKQVINLLFNAIYTTEGDFICDDLLKDYVTSEGEIIGDKGVFEHILSTFKFIE